LEKRFLVRVRYGRFGERFYPKMSPQERIFGSKPRRVTIAFESKLDGTRRNITKTEFTGVSMSVFDVVTLLQRELGRENVDRVIITAV
jgi:hypothetical protein